MNGECVLHFYQLFRCIHQISLFLHTYHRQHPAFVSRQLYICTGMYVSRMQKSTWRSRLKNITSNQSTNITCGTSNTFAPPVRMHYYAMLCHTGKYISALQLNQHSSPVYNEPYSPTSLILEKGQQLLDKYSNSKSSKWKKRWQFWEIAIAISGNIFL